MSAIPLPIAVVLARMEVEQRLSEHFSEALGKPVDVSLESGAPFIATDAWLNPSQIAALQEAARQLWTDSRRPKV